MPGRISTTGGTACSSSYRAREQPSPRPLLIFEEQPDHAFRLVARNEGRAARERSGQCDPFDPDDAADNGFAIKGHYFTVQNFVACGQHWSDYVTFRYDPRTHGWLFSNQIVTESFPLDDQPDHVTVTRADAHRPVSFGQWKRRTDAPGATRRDRLSHPGPARARPDTVTPSLSRAREHPPTGLP